MKSQDMVANPERAVNGGFRPGEAEQEVSKNGPTPQQIRERAFEVHIERGGIHGVDVDDWMQANVNSRKSTKTTMQERKRNDVAELGFL